MSSFHLWIFANSSLTVAHEDAGAGGRGADFMRWIADEGFHWHLRTWNNALSWTPRCLDIHLRPNLMCFCEAGNSETKKPRISESEARMLLSWEIHPAAPLSHLISSQPPFSKEFLPSLPITSLTTHATTPSLHPNSLTKVICDLRVTKPRDIFWSSLLVIWQIKRISH